MLWCHQLSIFVIIAFKHHFAVVQSFNYTTSIPWVVFFCSIRPSMVYISIVKARLNTSLELTSNNQCGCSSAITKITATLYTYMYIDIVSYISVMVIIIIRKRRIVWFRGFNFDSLFLLHWTLCLGPKQWFDIIGRYIDRTL